MNLHLYIVFDLTDINDYGASPMDCCRVMTDKDLRKEFLWAYNHGKIPHELIDDYQADPDYKHEDWTDMGNLRIGTMIDMLNDITNYECGTGYYIDETDVEVELNPKMVDDWLDTLNYWFEHIEDYGDRYPDMKPMVKRFDNVINDIYRMKKGV